MIVRSLAVIAALTAGAQGSHLDKGPVQEVTVCVGGDLPLRILPYAVGFADEMFGEIGVRVKWTYRQADCQGQHRPVVVLTFIGGLVEGVSHHALAYARPGESTVAIMSARFGWVENYPQLGPRVLAHVMVHEISHNLQGFARHSQTGIMKAHWVQADIDRMTVQPLKFEPYDVLLIRQGLATRGGGEVR